SFLFYLFYYHSLLALYLHSFPTRRSSDLVGSAVIGIVWIIHSLRRRHTGRVVQRSACAARQRAGGRERRRAVSQEIYSRVDVAGDRKSTRLNSSHVSISYAVFCLKKKKQT